jgi:hypothetical protein
MAGCAFSASILRPRERILAPAETLDERRPALEQAGQLVGVQLPR